MKKLLDPSPARAAAYVAMYPILLQVAKRHGYALAVHGSLHRDFDLVAIPWIEEASDALTLIRAFKKATRTVTQADGLDHLVKDCRPTEKPHGELLTRCTSRIAGCMGDTWTFRLCQEK